MHVRDELPGELCVEREIVSHPPRPPARPQAVVGEGSAPVGPVLTNVAAEGEVVCVHDDGVRPVDEAAPRWRQRSQKSRSSAAPENSSSNPSDARNALRSTAMLLVAKNRASAGFRL